MRQFDNLDMAPASNRFVVAPRSPFRRGHSRRPAMRTIIVMFCAFGLGHTALATAPTPGCDFHYYHGDRKIEAGDGFKVVAIRPEYQEVQTFGFKPASKTYQRKPAYDGGPWIQVEREVKPATNTIAQRRLITPGYFKIEDDTGQFVGRFEQAAEVQNYVCNVLYPNFGRTKKD